MPPFLPLQMMKPSASPSVDGRPQPPRVSEPEKKRGAPSTGSIRNPNSRLGRQPSPHSQGRVMEQSSSVPSFVGIDVSKDRLDVHVRPSGQAYATQRDGRGLAQLVSELRQLGPALIVLEATGGFEATLAAADLPLAVVNPRQIRDFARATGGLPRPTLSTPRPSPCLPSASAPGAPGAASGPHDRPLALRRSARRDRSGVRRAVARTHGGEAVGAAELRARLGASAPP